MSAMSDLDVIIRTLAESFVTQNGLSPDAEPLVIEAMQAGAMAAINYTADDGGLRPCRVCGGQFTGPGETCPVCRGGA